MVSVDEEGNIRSRGSRRFKSSGLFYDSFDDFFHCLFLGGDDTQTIDSTGTSETGSDEKFVLVGV